METRALRYFQAVAEFGSYSRGSEFLRISQPAVSRQVRRLEEELGSALFERHGQGVTLTEAGRILLERSQAVLRQLERTKDEIRSGKAGPSGTISFAVPPAAGNFLVPELVRRFSAACPNVFLRIVPGFSGHIHEWLVRGQVDLACAHDPLPQRGFEITPLLSEEIFLAGKPGTLPPRRRHISIKDLADLPLILPGRPNASRRLLDSWVAQHRTSLHVKIEVDDHSVIRALVRQGVGFTLLTRAAVDAELVHGDVQVLPFRPRATWTLALIMSADAARSDIVSIFARTVRDVARELTAAGAWPGRSLDQS